MLHYATTRLRGKALRWHATLDSSVRKDWDLFVQALFGEFPSVKESAGDGLETPVWSSTTLSLTPPRIGLFSNLDFQNVAPSSPVASEDVPHTMTTPPHGPQPFSASALQLSPRLYDPSFPGLHIGRLRILPEGGSTTPLYIWWGPPHVDTCCAKAPSRQNTGVLDLKNATAHIHEALIVSFVAIPEPHQVACLAARYKESWGPATFFELLGAFQDPFNLAR
ncbi:hypothetical protein M407DRAFT_22863 [Tulasnella calospora MUT 4182]|uniref:Retrotransposon gag domain-containing protein n=1 Tax=Tulasnella calospora MUT 4182 TaxID=1051891 RepID=A0A0C3QBP7_9AGAM|nr:hypothetical protein M407DRAFT_22863 [Tulasnella calospora MUT 4182]